MFVADLVAVAGAQRRAPPALSLQTTAPRDHIQEGGTAFANQNGKQAGTTKEFLKAEREEAEESERAARKKERFWRNPRGRK